MRVHPPSFVLFHECQAVCVNNAIRDELCKDLALFESGVEIAQKLEQVWKRVSM